MPVTFTPSYRALALGGVTAAVLIGVFALGRTAASPAAASTGRARSGALADAVVASSTGSARITVSGTGTVSGTPSQLVLSMGVQVNAASAGSALQQASQAASRVIAALRARGVAAADIQTSGLSLQPSYQGSSSLPDGYAVSESLTATLRHLGAVSAEIDATVRAGGNAATIDGVSLNLTDTSDLLARARAAAVADARVKAAQYASAIGRPLGPVLSITDQAPAQPYPIDATGSAATPHASSVPVSPGTQQLSVSVTVVYAMP